MKVLYGSAAKTGKDVWHKQCKCKATASGPRLYTRFHEDTYMWKAGMADLVCDACNIPWKKTANVEGAGDE